MRTTFTLAAAGVALIAIAALWRFRARLPILSSPRPAIVASGWAVAGLLLAGGVVGTGLATGVRAAPEVGASPGGSRVTSTSPTPFLTAPSPDAPARTDSGPGQVGPGQGATPPPGAVVTPPTIYTPPPTPPGAFEPPPTPFQPPPTPFVPPVVPTSSPTPTPTRSP